MTAAIVARGYRRSRLSSLGAIVARGYRCSLSLLAIIPQRAQTVVTPVTASRRCAAAGARPSRGPQGRACPASGPLSRGAAVGRFRLGGTHISKDTCPYLFMARPWAGFASARRRPAAARPAHGRSASCAGGWVGGWVGGFGCVSGRVGVGVRTQVYTCGARVRACSNWQNMFRHVRRKFWALS